MPGKSSQLNTELSGQNQRLLALFETAGHEFIDPEIIQPADVFLERAGEDIRSRTYVFSDPDGNELCLRPDITVPACRYHLANAPTPQTPARYCYAGPAFRHHSAGVRNRNGSPREFEQIGLEWFGATDAVGAEAEIFNLTIAAVELAGLKNYTVRLGDLGLFHALLSSIEMPERWRRRLAREFWRPRDFYKLLRRLTGEQPEKETSVSGLVERLALSGDNNPRALIEQILQENDWALVPGRSCDEIADRLAEKAADKNSPPLDTESASQINNYLNIHGDLKNVQAKLSAIARQSAGGFAAGVETLGKRSAMFDLDGMKNGTISFAAEFGRALEYYTGFVFQIEVTDVDGGPLVIAGGGRYDDLISDIGNCPTVPAVGSAIYSERLLAAIKRQDQ
ncbi:MAG TPA: ATP phosphoribosyltransferase regulatory subunit [Rhizobiales bacterium]|nr:ATP phosphoribosyltransferase regulatory subunit [Hyphomicrobiales bacterium]